MNDNHKGDPYAAWAGAEKRLQNAIDTIAALRAENLELEQEVKNLSVEIVKIKQDLYAEEKRGDMHSELNRRAAKALGKPFEGEGSTWHDIPECIAALRAELTQARGERDELRALMQEAIENCETGDCARCRTFAAVLERGQA